MRFKKLTIARMVENAAKIRGDFTIPRNYILDVLDMVEKG